jgi:spermidine synthase
LRVRVGARNEVRSMHANPPVSEREASSARPGDRRILRLLLPPSVFVSGAVVMVLEVLGTRLIGPVYGSSIYVWSALIAVTLLSLSLGYWLGGLISDRRPHAWLFFLLFELAALLLVAIPLVRVPVFAITRPLGLRGGALASATLFLAVPLTILGTVSPFAVRLAADLLDTIGRTAGRLYAISTAGSLVGTLLTGFYLIPRFRVPTIFFGAAISLLLPALTYQLAAARRHLVVAAVTVATLALVATRPIARSPEVPVVRESFFSEVKVLERPTYRALLLNGAFQTVTAPDSNASLALYPLVMARLAWQAVPDGKRALIVGLGGGVLPRLLASFGVRSRVIEIDPVVVEVAEQYFGFDREASDLTIGDGREFLANTDERYDYILLDAFAGEIVPMHLLSDEMMHAVAAHLEPGGVLLLNYDGYRGGKRARPLRSIVRTIEQSFAWRRVFPLKPRVEYEGNIVLAAKRPVELRRPDSPLPFEVAPQLRHELAAIAPVELRGVAVVLSDDYNPLDLWSVEAHEEWRRLALEKLSWDVLLAE